jgi:hypothetical protein
MAFLLTVTGDSFAQCSICTKTAQQLGDKPAKALNSGIIYVMCTYWQYRLWVSVGGKTMAGLIGLLDSHRHITSIT